MRESDVFELIQYHKPPYADDRFANITCLPSGLELIYYTDRDRVCKRITYSAMTEQWSFELGGVLCFKQSLKEVREAICSFRGG